GENAWPGRPARSICTHRIPSFTASECHIVVMMIPPVEAMAEGRVYFTLRARVARRQSRLPGHHRRIAWPNPAAGLAELARATGLEPGGHLWLPRGAPAQWPPP